MILSALDRLPIKQWIRTRGCVSDDSRVLRRPELAHAHQDKTSDRLGLVHREKKRQVLRGHKIQHGLEKRIRHLRQGKSAPGFNNDVVTNLHAGFVPALFYDDTSVPGFGYVFPHAGS